MMNRLELRSLIQRLPKGEKPAAEQLPEINAKTIEISNAEQLSELTEKLKNAKRVAVCIGERMHVATDTETQYDISLGGGICGLSAGIPKRKHRKVPVRFKTCAAYTARRRHFPEGKCVRPDDSRLPASCNTPCGYIKDPLC